MTNASDKQTKKDFFRRLLYIGICAIPIYLLRNEDGPLRFLVLGFFLFGMYQLLLMIALSPLTINAFFPPKVLYEEKPKRFDTFMYYFSSAMFFVGLVCLIFEIRTIDNTINGIQLFWLSGLSGVVLAAVVTLLLKLFHPSVYYESKRRYMVHSGLFLGFFLFMAATASFVNRTFAEKEEVCVAYEIIRKGTSSSRRGSKEYFIFLNVPSNKEERFAIDKALHQQLSEGGYVELCKVKGTLGFDFVTGFKVAGF